MLELLIELIVALFGKETILALRQL